MGSSRQRETDGIVDLDALSEMLPEVLLFEKRSFLRNIPLRPRRPRPVSSHMWTFPHVSSIYRAAVDYWMNSVWPRGSLRGVIKGEETWPRYSTRNTSYMGSVLTLQMAFIQNHLTGAHKSVRDEAAKA